MSGPEWSLQTAVRAALLADPGVQAQLGTPARIYDEPPDDAVFPYLTFGRAESRPLDGDDGGSVEQVLHLHLWSRYAGRREAKAAATAVRAALDGASLAAEGFRHAIVRATYTDIHRAGDGRTTQGVVRLRALSEPV